MKKGTRNLLLLVAAAIFYFHSRTDLKTLFHLTPEKIETLAYFQAGDPSTFPAFEAQIKGAGLTRNKANQILVDASSQGILLTPFDSAQPGHLTLHMGVDGDPGRQAAISLINGASGDEHPLKSSMDFSHFEVNVTPHVKKGVFDSVAYYSRGSAGRYVVLEEFSLRRIPSLPAIPPFHTLALGLSVMLLAARLARREKNNNQERILFVSIGLVLLAGLSLPNSFLFRPVFWLAVFLALLTADQWLMKKGRPLDHGLLWGLLLIAFCARWQGMEAAVGQHLEGDAPGYFERARQAGFGFPIAYNGREPFYIWAQSLLGRLWGFFPFQFRLLTVFLSVGNVALSYVLFQRLSGQKIAAVCGAAFMALGKFAIWNATRGERSELFLFLILFYFVVLVSQNKSGVKSNAVLGLLAGLASLTWLIGLVGTLLAYVAFAIRSRPALKSVAAFGAVLALLLTPHLLHQWKAWGDPFYSVNAHTNFYKNQRETGVPSLEGEKQSLLHYVVKGEGPRILVDAASGYFHMFLNPQDRMNLLFLGFADRRSWAFYPFLMAGIVLCLKRRQAGVFILLFSLLNISPAFLKDVYDVRLFLHAAPFGAYFAGVGLAASGGWILPRLRLKKG